MIFVSIGSMLPFDRMVRAVDEWAATNPQEELLIQIGEGEYEPRHARWVRMMPPADYRKALRDCRFFVAHVGMGSILQGLEEEKSMLLMIRDHRRGEHTTDHQYATADRFRGRSGITIVEHEDDLKGEMSRMLKIPPAASEGIAAMASPELLRNVRGFLVDALGAPPAPMNRG